MSKFGLLTQNKQVAWPAETGPPDSASVLPFDNEYRNILGSGTFMTGVVSQFTVTAPRLTLPFSLLTSFLTFRSTRRIGTDPQTLSFVGLRPLNIARS